MPLQGVVQGNGGLFFGSAVPCALFYFLQLYFRRNRSPKSENTTTVSNNSPSPEVLPPPPPVLERCHSRSHLSPRSPSGPAHISSRAVSSGDSLPYFVGLTRFAEDPFHEFGNPDGIIQLGLPQNHVGLCFFRK